MIAGYERNPDGTVTFKDENGMTVLNAPGDHPMVAQKIEELGMSPGGPGAAGMALNMPGGSGMGPATQNGQVTPNMAVSQMGLNLPDPTMAARQTMGGGQPPPGMPPPGYGQPPPPSRSKRSVGASPFGKGPAGPGFQAAASRGFHSLGNAIAGDHGGDGDKREPARDPYNRMTELAGQSGMPMDPEARRAYEAAHARMAQAREEEMRAAYGDKPPPAVTGMRPGYEGAFAPVSGDASRAFVAPGVASPSQSTVVPPDAPVPPGMRRDPATGALIPNVPTDEERRKEEDQGG